MVNKYFYMSLRINITKLERLLINQNLSRLKNLENLGMSFLPWARKGMALFPWT
jgi:hypothetical protein